MIPEVERMMCGKLAASDWRGTTARQKQFERLGLERPAQQEKRG